MRLTLPGSTAGVNPLFATEGWVFFPLLSTETPLTTLLITRFANLVS
jgi:hypothetical protein